VISVTKDGYMGLIIYIMGGKVARMEQRNIQWENITERNHSEKLGCRSEDNTKVDLTANSREPGSM